MIGLVVGLSWFLVQVWGLLVGFGLIGAGGLGWGLVRGFWLVGFC